MSENSTVSSQCLIIQSCWHPLMELNIIDIWLHQHLSKELLHFTLFRKDMFNQKIPLKLNSYGRTSRHSEILCKSM